MERSLSMRRATISLVIALLSLTQSMFAQSVLVINTAKPDVQLNQVVITGTNLGPLPTVTLAGAALQLISATSTQIVAKIPAGLFGTYLLIVRAGSLSDDI